MSVPRQRRLRVQERVGGKLPGSCPEAGAGSGLLHRSGGGRRAAGVAALLLPRGGGLLLLC
jgi:hypothetical protein